MNVDTETRQEAAERLVRALYIGTIGSLLVFAGLLLAVVVAIVDIVFDGVFGQVEIIALVTGPLTDYADRVLTWYSANVIYIAGGGSRKPALFP